MRTAASVQGVEFSRELRNDILTGDITVSIRLWKQPRVKRGARYRHAGPIDEDTLAYRIEFHAVGSD
jgi:hypothetical protein